MRPAASRVSGGSAVGHRRPSQQRAASRRCAAAHNQIRVSETISGQAGAAKLTLGDGQAASGQEKKQPHLGRRQPRFVNTQNWADADRRASCPSICALDLLLVSYAPMTHRFRRGSHLGLYLELLRVCPALAGSCECCRRRRRQRPHACRMGAVGVHCPVMMASRSVTSKSSSCL